jgi:hypothetical protein
MKKPDVMLLLSDARGVYIPRDFALEIKRDHVSGVDDKTWATLEAGPTNENEWYWEAWHDVCDRAIVTDDDGVKYSVYQDGDCWLVPEGMEYNETEGFIWPSESERA